MSIVLIAEDNATDRALLKYAWGAAKPLMDMIFVRDGSEVMAYLNGDGRFSDRKQYPLPKILVLDLNMPRVDGFEVLYWLKDRAQLRDLEVFVLTGLDEETARSKLNGARAHFFTKPADAASYIEFVEALGRVESKPNGKN